MATDRVHPTPSDLSMAAGSPSTQRAITSAPRSESPGKDHLRAKAATTRASPAATPPTVSTTSRGTAKRGRVDAGHSIRISPEPRAGLTPSGKLFGLPRSISALFVDL